MITYYPYLRAKQFDVKAVEKAATKLVANGHVTPIFEPVTVESRALLKRAATFGGLGLPVALVLNPSVGELIGSLKETTKMIADMRSAGATVYPALIVQNATQATEVAALNAIANGGNALFVHRGVPAAQQALNDVRATQHAVHLFHEGATSLAHEGTFGPRARLRDGFQAQLRNSSYPPRSFFGDIHLTYSNTGFVAFGDFATIGAAYNPSGGPAFAVVLHLTEQTPQGIDCNHFLSVSNATQANPAGKFGEAVDAVHSYVQQNPGRIDFSDACKELLKLRTQGHFPGLGDLKRLSIQHHLELMCQIV